MPYDAPMGGWTLEGFALESLPAWGGGGEPPSTLEILEEPWSPRRPSQAPIPEPLFFLDGKERVDAVVSKDGKVGLLVTVAAGLAVYRQGRMEVLEPVVRRYGLGVDEPLEAPSLRYEPLPQADPRRYVEAMHRLRVELEREVAQRAAASGEGLLVQDGPIFWGARGAVLGFVKTHWARYLPAEREGILQELAPGERTPAFVVEREAGRFASWYVRLDPTPWGLLRVEAPISEGLREMADLSGTLFAFFAAHPLRDRRAPQNLFPIGSIERHLARHMGAEEVVRRALAERFGRDTWKSA